MIRVKEDSAAKISQMQLACKQLDAKLKDSEYQE
jgi:hypothetical protein